MTTPILLIPDAGPLITLAYAEALDVLLKPGWLVQIVDMVLYEVTRNQTPTSQSIAAWADKNKIRILPTKIFEHYKRAQESDATAPRKSNLGELAVQEAMTQLVLNPPMPIGVFLFEDHKIARAGFVLPENCRKVSTRAFLTFLEQKNWLKSAAAVERKAILNGRNFSQIRFPPS
jgi:hypothetical protein